MLKQAIRLRNLFELTDNKTKYCFKLSVIGTDKDYEKLSEFMREINTSEDFIYQKVVNCLEWIISNGINELDDSSSDMLSEAIDSEVSVYTSDLTDWLGSHNSNIYYLNEVLAEYGTKDGFQALSQAQRECISEIWNGLIGLLEGGLND